MQNFAVQKPIAVFNAGPITSRHGVFYEACKGDNDDVFRNACGLPRSQVVKLEVQQDVRMPDPDAISGVIVSGSPSMVTELEPWAERTAAWIRANKDRVPMLGVCYGHQLIAHALGGTVGWNGIGPEYGTVEIEKTEEGRTDLLMREAPDSFLAQAAHHQTVVQMPPGAVVLARGLSGVQAARFSQRTWGLQFHPEYDGAISRALLEFVRSDLAREGFDVGKAHTEVRDSPRALDVLRSFARMCGLLTISASA